MFNQQDNFSVEVQCDVCKKKKKKLETTDIRGCLHKLCFHTSEDCKLLPYNQVCAEQSWKVQYLSTAVIHFQYWFCTLEIVMLQFIFVKSLIFNKIFFNKLVFIYWWRVQLSDMSRQGGDVMVWFIRLFVCFSKSYGRTVIHMKVLPEAELAQLKSDQLLESDSDWIWI